MKKMMASILKAATVRRNERIKIGQYNGHFPRKASVAYKETDRMQRRTK